MSALLLELLKTAAGVYFGYVSLCFAFMAYRATQRRRPMDNLIDPMPRLDADLPPTPEVAELLAALERKDAEIAQLREARAALTTREKKPAVVSRDIARRLAE